MLPFYQFGQQVITALTNIANFFFLPMNSPEFLQLANPVGLDIPFWSQGLLNGLFDFLVKFGGNLSLMQFLLSVFLPVFFVVTLFKWILPTS